LGVFFRGNHLNIAVNKISNKGTAWVSGEDSSPENKLNAGDVGVPEFTAIEDIRKFEISQGRKSFVHSMTQRIMERVDR